MGDGECALLPEGELRHHYDAARDANRQAAYGVDTGLTRLQVDAIRRALVLEAPGLLDRVATIGLRS